MPTLSQVAVGCVALWYGANAFALPYTATRPSSVASAPLQCGDPENTTSCIKFITVHHQNSKRALHSDSEIRLEPSFSDSKTEPQHKNAGSEPSTSKSEPTKSKRRLFKAKSLSKSKDALLGEMSQEYTSAKQKIKETKPKWDRRIAPWVQKLKNASIATKNKVKQAFMNAFQITQQEGAALDSWSLLDDFEPEFDEALSHLPSYAGPAVHTSEFDTERIEALIRDHSFFHTDDLMDSRTRKNKRTSGNAIEALRASAGITQEALSQADKNSCVFVIDVKQGRYIKPFEEKSPLENKAHRTGADVTDIVITNSDYEYLGHLENELKKTEAVFLLQRSRSMPTLRQQQAPLPRKGSQGSLT